MIPDNKCIDILGVKYQIVKRPLMRERSCWGEIDYLNQRIEIEEALAAEKLNIVLMHEILHGIFETLGFADENANEHLVQSLATAIYKVFVDNKDTLNFI